MKIKSCFLALGILLVAGCAHRTPLTTFSDNQKEKTSSANYVREAEILFWASVYEPTKEDLEALKGAWNEHSKAFPESAAIKEIEKVVNAPGERALLVSVFTADYDRSDLLDKSLGWSVNPVPNKIIELKDSDQVLRVLFPVENIWARYFLLKYTNPIWSDGIKVTIGRSDGVLELEKH